VSPIDLDICCDTAPDNGRRIVKLLTDHCSLSVLTAQFPRALVERVLSETARSQAMAAPDSQSQARNVHE